MEKGRFLVPQRLCKQLAWGNLGSLLWSWISCSEEDMEVETKSWALEVAEVSCLLQTSH